MCAEPRDTVALKALDGRVIIDIQADQRERLDVSRELCLVLQSWFAQGPAQRMLEV